MLFISFRVNSELEICKDPTLIPNNDGHLSMKGNTVIANAIINKIQDFDSYNLLINDSAGKEIYNAFKYLSDINLLKNNKEIEDIIKPTKDTNIMLYIRKKLIHNSNLVVVGFYAYNYYISKINKKAILNNFPYYEVISNNLKNDSKIIYNILKKKYSLTIKEYYPFFQFLDRRIEYYHNNKLILVLYGNNSRCTVYRYSLKKKTYFGTFNLILMYFLINYFYNIINKMYKKSKLYLILLIKLWYNRNLYLSKYNITVFDSSPFQDFTLKCHGIPVHPLRKSLLQNLKKKKFKFNPSKDNIIKEQTFDNTSGNQILNEKYLILKNNI